jgi:ATP/ADP translocase
MDTLSKIFLIQKNETTQFVKLYILSFLIGLPQIASNTASSVLIIRDFTPEVLPMLYAYSGLGIVIISTILLSIVYRRCFPC